MNKGLFTTILLTQHCMLLPCLTYHHNGKHRLGFGMLVIQRLSHSDFYAVRVMSQR